ncbi:MAG: cobalt-zinc-cadmium efflux system outer membrane protein [Polyangiales bacterium]|jgi:cobalt-zinc-cadmium efflux system outer membrane protein
MEVQRVLLFGILLTACAGASESHLRDELSQAALRLAPIDESEAKAPEIDGSIASYVGFALAQSPALRASYERWRATTLRIAATRTLPDPVVSYGYFARSVQTRVGPQRHRLGIRQSFPWPSRLRSAATAQSARALAAQKRFEARAMTLVGSVSEAWWRLWWIRRAREVQNEQLEILTGLVEALRGGMETGRVLLADVSQVDLRRSRLRDAIEGLREDETSAEAALRGVLGTGAPAVLPTLGEDALSLPAESLEELSQAVREHPFIQAYGQLAEAADAQADALWADRLPRFTIGADWIETGARAAAGDESGDDAVIVSVGLSVPLWQGARADEQHAAEADAYAERAEQEHAEDGAIAELHRALAAVRDSHRRVHLYRHTLLPQAQSVYESVTGAYVVGQGSVASTLLAQRELLELALGVERALAEHGVAWAQLERVTGRTLARDVSNVVSNDVSNDEAPVGDAPVAPNAPLQDENGNELDHD